MANKRLTEFKESGLSINIRLFASLREVIGKDEIKLKVSDHTNIITIADLKKRVFEIYPHLLRTDKFIVAVNYKVVAGDDTTVTPLDEIAIFPPVSGG